MSTRETEISLKGPGAGGGTVRIGETVRRDPGRTTTGMIHVLEHLERIEFPSAPRALGRDEQGRFIVTYIPGDVVSAPYAPWMISDELMISVAQLLRRYHDAVAGLRLPSALDWGDPAPPGFEGRTVGHMDVSMSNVVCRAGMAYALIDFEEVAVVSPVWDVIRAARHWVPLLDPQDLRTAGLGALAGRQSVRLGKFLDAYGLDPESRAEFVRGAVLSTDVTFERMRRGAMAGHEGYLREWTGYAAARNRRSNAWIRGNAHRLSRVATRNRGGTK